jgi:uncharacterized membrane protein (DUF373 family)
VSPLGANRFYTAMSKGRGRLGRRRQRSKTDYKDDNTKTGFSCKPAGVNLTLYLRRALSSALHYFMKPTKIFGISFGEWNAMSFYGRFEQIVTWILTLFIAAIIAIALFRLVVTILQLLVFGALNPLNHEEFEVIFGMIMTLLIAMEFNHSILQSMERLHRIVQVKTVVLISILALARKFIILNIEATPALTIIALGFAVIALGVVYWLMRERDDRSAGEARGKPSAIQ